LALAQQVLGSPGATTTIDGKQLPPNKTLPCIAEVSAALQPIVLLDYGGVDERTATAVDQLIPVERRLYGKRRKQ
jgi:hypothetical protein